jgi:hypothetical protein
MEPVDLFSLRRKACCGFLSSLEIHNLEWVLSREPWGPMASTLTITLPVELYIHTYVLFSCVLRFCAPVVVGRGIGKLFKVQIGLCAHCALLLGKILIRIAITMRRRAVNNITFANGFIKS